MNAGTGGPGGAARLVEDDPVEARTRAAYRAMMRRAMSVCDDLSAAVHGADLSLADGGGWASPPAPADPPAGGPPWPAVDGPDPGDALAGARQACGQPGSPFVHVPESLPSPRPGPLEGLPMAVKDLLDVAGQPTRNGTPGGGWRLPRESSAAWERLAEEGAVCVGKTATHEMGWGATTPSVYHPADARRLVGGSSGGSAAAVAAGLVPAALGSDTGGSVSIPAALAGVVGLRPTRGTVPLSGATPMAPAQDAIGPMAREVAMCLRLLGVLAARPVTPPVPEVRGLRVGVLAVDAVQPDVIEQVGRAVDRLAAEGARPVPVTVPETAAAAAVSLLVMLHGSSRLWAAAVVARPQHWGSEARALLTLGSELADGDALRARHGAAVMRGALARAFAEASLDVLVLPTTPCTAPLRGQDVVDVGGRQQSVPAALSRFASLPAVTGLPALSVPCGADRSGLPVGLLVLGPPGAEPVLGRIGASVEARRAG